ncbi:hypothetical protein EUTSA_v10015179mg [Eutrema salsugineum]|uniref:Metalloenzyme domain-containing protein n=1 Tax=Eutrema salsugineum TaxID=72664 RepID=V4LUX4_EUTSA|nr:hypothetical protein EUTSA_v10015179mg [Eutrema salsugineum]
MGNSEVGHNALGAGRIYAQGAKLCDIALAASKIFDGEGFKYVSESFEKSTLHFAGRRLLLRRGLRILSGRSVNGQLS